jgi:hypothetical protein
MAKKNIKNKVEIEGELSIIPGGFIKEVDSNLNLEDVVFDELTNKGYGIYNRFRYKIILERKE